MAGLDTRGLSVRLDGTKACQKKLELIATLAKTETQQAIISRALIIQSEIRKELSKPGSGTQYRRGNKIHTASAPGQPPAVDTGRYRSSIGTFFYLGGLAAEVGTKLRPYPGYLEPPPIGVEKGVSDRPALSTVWAIQEPLYIEDVRQALRMLGR